MSAFPRCTQREQAIAAAQLKVNYTASRSEFVAEHGRAKFLELDDAAERLDAEWSSCCTASLHRLVLASPDQVGTAAYFKHSGAYGRPNLPRRHARRRSSHQTSRPLAIWVIERGQPMPGRHHLKTSSTVPARERLHETFAAPPQRTVSERHGRRVQGSRNKLQGTFFDALLKHWDEVGSAAIDIVFKDSQRTT